MRIIPQRSTAFLTLEFRNIKGIPEPPLRAVYQIDDLTTGTNIRLETEFIVPQSGFFTIKLTQDDNDLINIENYREHRRVSVTGYYNEDQDEVPGVYDYGIDRVLLQ